VPGDTTSHEAGGDDDDDEEEDGDEVEGYHVYVGGGYGEHRGIGRQVYESIPADDLPFLIEQMVRVYLEHRADEAERFRDFTRRYEVDALRDLFGQIPTASVS